MDSLKNFRMISVPFTSKNQTWSIRMDHEYLIVSSDRTRYQFLKFADLQRCTNFGTELICWSPYNWNMARVKACEWNIFNEISNENCTVDPNQGTSVWYNIGENQWLFYSKFGSDLAFACHNGVFREKIEGSGLLRLNQNCTLKNFDMEINCKRSFHGRRIDVMIPKIDKYHDTEIKWEHTMFNSNWSLADINESKEAIEVIKQDSSLPAQLNQLLVTNMTYIIMQQCMC